MKLFFLISLLMFPALAFAQEENANPNAGCAEVLAAPPFVDMLTRNEGNDFQDISYLKSGPALYGLECSVGELTVFFESAGWELTDYVTETYGWVEGEYIRLPEDERPSRLFFCVKEPLFWGLFPRCVASARVFLIGSRVSSTAANVSK